jgi:alpha-tubulin suppressor-like RCC1 family protein
VLVVALAVALTGCQEDALSPTVPESTPTLASVTSGLAFRLINAGALHTCGITTDYRAYCWGDNRHGQLGDGSTTNRLVPRAVAGGLRFRNVSAGHSHTCAVTPENRVYCWGFNFEGQLGDGTGYPVNIQRLTPVPVAGGRRFLQVRAGYHHTCAIEYKSDAAFCWGYNVFGQLGDGTREKRWKPVRVHGGLHFRQLSAGIDHTCGVTKNDKGFCWGMNFWGQLGNGTNVGQSTPVRAGGRLRFHVVHAARAHSCGLTLDKRAYCWGGNNFGQLGDGTRTGRNTPAPVRGGLRFDNMSGRDTHTCAVTPGNRAYCWGDNSVGQVGDGTSRNDRLTPVAVTGGLLFNGVSAGYRYSCGVSLNDRAYCWGVNGFGQLGNGTTTDSRTPTAVAGAM